MDDLYAGRLHRQGSQERHPCRSGQSRTQTYFNRRGARAETKTQKHVKTKNENIGTAIVNKRFGNNGRIVFSR